MSNGSVIQTGITFIIRMSKMLNQNSSFTSISLKIVFDLEFLSLIKCTLYKDTHVKILNVISKNGETKCYIFLLSPTTPSKSFKNMFTFAVIKIKLVKIMPQTNNVNVAYVESTYTSKL